MPNFEPTWETIASSLEGELRNVEGVKYVTSRYPENAIAKQDLAWIVLSEPNFSIVPVSFGAAEVVYSGELQIYTLAIPIGQAELSTSDKNLCRNIGLTVQLYMHSKRFLIAGSSRLHLVLGEAQIAKFSPYDQDSRGHYAGVVMPFTVRVAYTTGT